MLYKAMVSSTLTSLLFYTYNTATNGYLGKYDLSSTFAPTFQTLNDKSAPHDMLVWNNRLFIADGRYVDRYDGADVTDGTWRSQFLDLGSDWEVTKLVPTNNYIAVCAWKKHSQGSSSRTESKVFFWNGIETTYSYSVPVSDNKIENSINYNGNIILFTVESRLDSFASLKRLTDYGVDKISNLTFPISGTKTYFFNPRLNAIDFYNNKVVWGNGGTAADSYASVFAYGRDREDGPYSLTQIGEPIATVGYYVGAVKVVSNSKIFVSGANATSTYILKRLIIGNTAATYRGTYIDLGQRVQLNYAKVYFKPLASGDSATLTLDTDYGTSNTPKTNSGVISYAIDGATTYKKFDLGGIQCHAVRPVVSWSAGGMAISKIILDYDFIND